MTPTDRILLVATLAATLICAAAYILDEVVGL